MQILIVVTSHAELGATGAPTGYYLPEVAHPYAAFTSHGFDVNIASLKGGPAPLDGKSLKLDDAVTKAFWENKATRHKLEHTFRLADVEADDYDGVFFAGGHGAMWDFEGEPVIADFVREIYERGGVVGTVCHGAAALVDVKLANDTYLVAGKRVTAFSDAEEQAAELDKVVPFHLETALVKRGAQYTKSGLWQPHVVTDGRLVTGQNPASAAGTSEAMARVLEANTKARSRKGESRRPEATPPPI